MLCCRYRAKVEKAQGNNASVLYVDYGNVRGRCDIFSDYCHVPIMNERMLIIDFTLARYNDALLLYGRAPIPHIFNTRC